MLRFFRSLFAAAPRPTPSATPEDLDALLDPAIPPTPERSQQICRALRELSMSARLDLDHARALLDAWYAQHPIEVRWPSEYDLLAEDPLEVDIDAVAASRDDLTLPPWVQLLRSLDVNDGGVVFHHGISLSELMLVLQDPHAPTFEAFHAPPIVDDSGPADWAPLVEYVVDHPRMQNIRHLGLGANQMTPDLVQMVLGSTRAAQLRSLDLCECLVDRDEDEVLATLGAMSGLRDIEHLNLYNCVHTAAHMRALAAHRFPKLTHLSIGSADVDDELVDVLRTTDAFPALRALSLPTTPPLAAWMKTRGIAGDVMSRPHHGTPA